MRCVPVRERPGRRTAVAAHHDDLCRVRRAGTSGILAEYRYNALGQRIGWQIDTDADGTVETTGTDDPWTYGLYNERWQLVAEIENESGVNGAAAKQTPDALYAHHGAGLGGSGSSSYIDEVILVDNDDSGTLDQRTYYVQNWRHDVVALLEHDGELLEVTDYTPYGEAIDVLLGDFDRDGA